MEKNEQNNQNFTHRLVQELATWRNMNNFSKTQQTLKFDLRKNLLPNRARGTGAGSGVTFEVCLKDELCLH